MTAPEIILNGQPYRLARQKGQRRWQRNNKMIAAPRIERRHVIDGEIARERVAIYNDWSKGQVNDRTADVGGIHIAQNIDVTHAGSMRSVGRIRVSAGPDTSARHIIPLYFNGTLYICWGRYAYSLYGDELLLKYDFGADYPIKDAVAFNQCIVFAFGTAQNIATMNDTETFAIATDNIKADYLAVVDNRLWAAWCANSERGAIASMAAYDDTTFALLEPLTLANWSSSIPVDDDTTDITGLMAYGEKIAIAKSNGLFFGDVSLSFPNSLDQLKVAVDSNTGRRAFVRGSDIFVPHTQGLIRYTLGASEEVGVQQYFDSYHKSDDIPGTLITTGCAIGDELWAAARPAMGPKRKCYFLIDSTDYTTQITDNLGVGVDLDGLLDDEWAYVGDSAVFYGADFQLASANYVHGWLEFQYYNGSAWATLPPTVPSVLIDDTVVETFRDAATGSTVIPLAQNGLVYWPQLPSDWASTTVGSYTGYFIRFRFVSASGTEALAQCHISQVRTCPNQPWVQIYRGKTAEQGEATSSSITWQPIMRLDGNEEGQFGITEVLAMIPWIAGGRAGGRVDGMIYFTREAMGEFLIPNSNTPFRLTTNGVAIGASDDMGTPDSPKEFLSIQVSGKKIDADHQIDVYYRTDDTSTWTLAEQNIQASPHTIDLSSVQGYRCQLKVVTHPVLHDEKTEVNCIALRARELRNLDSNLKREYILTLILGAEQTSSGNYAQPTALMQITALEDLLGTGSVAFIDPLGVSRTVTVESVETGEVMQADESPPVILAQISVMEV